VVNNPELENKAEGRKTKVEDRQCVFDRLESNKIVMKVVKNAH